MNRGTTNRLTAATFWLLGLLLGCTPDATPPTDVRPSFDINAAGADTFRIPLNDLGAGTYKGFKGGLYLNGSNRLPDAHRLAGVARARAIRPLSSTGAPDVNGKIVLLSVGMSNTSQEFCTQVESGAPPCSSWTFIGQAKRDAAVNNAKIVFVNGARSYQTAPTWDAPTDVNYDFVRDFRLAPAGVTEKQVQVVWLKLANVFPTVALPASNSDAFTLTRQIGAVARALKVRYPNLKQVFLSSRIYGGYARGKLNPEPYAYESGFAVKWAIEAQILQMQGGGSTPDPRTGNLNYNTVAPWLAWGPYPWADGVKPRSDGLTWVRTELEIDGVHPSTTGEQKVAAMLLTHFKTTRMRRCYFVTGVIC